MTAENLKNERLLEEKKQIYNDPLPDNDHFLNANITFKELENVINILGKKKSSVGCDGLSYTLLRHLPPKWLEYFHIIICRCWENGHLPTDWKKSIVIPILKKGKKPSDPTSYRPIALTSCAGKIMEKIILDRLVYYCNKNNIIPKNQTGFRKNKSATDHLVKLSTNIKHQFAKRKSILATFFDVKKAYDRVWHSRLLMKLKNVGLSGNIYNYIKDFLSSRQMIARVGNVYSKSKQTNLGIPQGSIISPLLFNILVHDLPTAMGPKITILQYADDIAMYMKVPLKRQSSLYDIKYFQKIYQIEVDRLTNYMKTNGLELSQEKTNMILFNNGITPKKLPCIHIDGKEISYVTQVKFLGVIFTQKLNWKSHIEHLLQKALKNLNLIKVIAHKPWGQNTKMLVHLAISLVRSILCYGQEVYFSAAKSLLKRLESVDCKALKIALGTPIHTSNQKVYKETNIEPLDEYRKKSCAKYITRVNNVDNFIQEELLLKSDTHFPKRAQNIHYLQTIASYTQDVFDNTELFVTENKFIQPIPSWELKQAKFDIFHSNIRKEDNIHLLACETREHLNKEYYNYLKIFTDGSLCDSGDTGAGFVIPALNITKSYYLGKDHSIFTAELIAILMALNTINSMPKQFISIAICVDSQSVLQSLKNNNPNERPEIIFEIQYNINTLINKGTIVTFCWVPSHCGLKYNEWADQAAKQGAKNVYSTEINLIYSLREKYHILEQKFKKPLKSNTLVQTGGYTRRISSLAYRLYLNAWRTKYCKDIFCTCSERITIGHLFFQCKDLKHIQQLITVKNVSEIEFQTWLKIAQSLNGTPIEQYL